VLVPVEDVEEVITVALDAAGVSPAAVGADTGSVEAGASHDGSGLASAAPAPAADVVEATDVAVAAAAAVSAGAATPMPAPDMGGGAAGAGAGAVPRRGVRMAWMWMSMLPVDAGAW